MYIFKAYSYIILLLIFLSHYSWGQKTEFEHISDQDGLCNSSITSILKDSDGYMWFSTFNGLARYDGYTFKNFLHDPKNPNSISSNRIWGLLESKEKVIYVATPYNGFSTYNRNTETFTNYLSKSGDSLGLSHNMVFSIYEDRKGNMWIGTVAGLDKFNFKTKTFQHYSPFYKDSLNYISSISEDIEGNLWLYGLSTKVCKFNVNQNSYEYLKFSDDSRAGEVFNHGGIVLCDKKGNLWIGNRLEGLLKINLKTGNSERYNVENKRLKSNVIMSIKEDREGYIWICTDGGGAYQYEHQTNRFKIFEYDPNNTSSLSSNAVYCMHESEPGLVWIGTYAAGLNVLKQNKKKFLKFSAQGNPGKKLLQKSVLAIAPAENGKVWLATDGGGLNLFDPNKYDFSYYTEQNGKVAANVITCLLRDREKNLWCGSYRRGMCKIDARNGSIEVFNSDIKKKGKELYKNNVFSLAESSEGKILIGFISAGIDVYDKKTGNISRSPLNTIAGNILANNSIFKIIEDSKKRIWIGTENSGAFCYNPINSTLKQFAFDKEKKGTIGSNDVRDILEDDHGTMWFATGKGGLSKLINFDKDFFETYTMQDGLPTHHILNILEDSKNNLWLSTDKGITYFNIKENKFLNFDLDDGLQSRQFNGNSKLKTSNGYMYFGGIEGFNMFHPDSIRINQIKPPVVITDFKILNHSLQSNEIFNEKKYLDKSISQTKKIELGYEDRVFSIEFSALSFISPQSNQYAYKLEGFDKNWIYVNADKRFANYTNLNPGIYNFRVIASNNDGVWNTTGTSLKITILPPWWMTWWFRTLVALMIISGVFLFIYLRTRSIRMRNIFLEEEVRKQTAGLISSNQEITLKNKILEKNNLEISKKTERILEQQEEILKQKSEVEQLNKTKDKIFSIIAHDLKNPVNALAILSKSLKSEFKQITGTGSELINHVEISSERIKNLIFNLLEWTKSQTGNIKVFPVRISVHRLIEENIQLHYTVISQKQISIEEEKDESVFIIADYNMVSTIVRNILSNGIKYTPKGGSIVISYYTDQDEVIISFKDNGIGIGEETLNRLFNPGMNVVSAKGTDDETGTGLGLIISKEFAELNNGDIYVESKVGNGSTFFLCMPEGTNNKEQKQYDNGLINYYTEKSIEEPEEQLDELKEINIKDQFRGKKILLVDDDHQVRESVKSILNSVFEIYEASDVKDALAISEKILPDFIISDVTMPGETGIDFCNYIKGNWVTSHIPVILLTGQSSKGTHLEGLMAGADAYITKPFDKNILLSTINNLLTFLDNIKIRFSSDTDLLPSKYTRNKLDEEILSKAIKYIEQNISDTDLNGDMLCKELGISKTVLYTKLKNITGQTVNEFIRIIRLKKSVLLLIEGKLNITQISSEMGFNSASYFTKSFTAHFGLSPKEYTNQYKREISSPHKD